MSTAAVAGTRRIVTLTPNPALDITLHVEGVRLGETHRVPTGANRAGGKGLNVARVAHQQGHAVLAIAPAGGATGQQFAAELASSGVPHRLVSVKAETRRTVALVDTSADQTTIFNESGSPLDPSEWEALTTELDRSLNEGGPAAPGPGVLVVSGSLPPEAPPEFYTQVVELAHSHGIPVVIDTSGPGLLEAAQAGADLLKPNREEIQEATGISDPVQASLELLRLGAQRVLTSSGAEGMLAFEAGTRSRYWTARLPQPLRGNPTSAGDAAVAATAVQLASGTGSMQSIVRAAASWSAAAVLMPLAGQISPLHERLEHQLIIAEKEVG
jgi:hypothetical protein